MPSLSNPFSPLFLPLPVLFSSVFFCMLFAFAVCMCWQSHFACCWPVAPFSLLFRLLRTVVVASRSSSLSVFSFPVPLLYLTCDFSFVRCSFCKTPRVFSFFALLLFLSLHATNFASFPAHVFLRSLHAACRRQTKRSRG
jgi:hypothetical protein